MPGLGSAPAPAPAPDGAPIEGTTTLLDEPAKLGRGRRIMFWVAISVVVLVVGAVIALSRPPLSDVFPESLAPDSTAANGARAVAQVLSDTGHDVITTESRESAARDAVGATLVVPPTPALSDEAFASLISTADVVVLISPSSAQLAVALDAHTSGYSGEVLAPDCSFEWVADLDGATIGTKYAADHATACFADGSGAGLLVTERDDQTIIAFDGDAVMTNETVGSEGNAALVLRVLGQRDTVVWYLPTPADSDSALEPQSIGDLTPAWVSPVIAMLLASALAAAWWRGRRFGPLVVENLPVTVKMSETLEGRARLYAKSRDAAHAGTVIRRASTQRIAKMLGMSRTAPASDVAHAVAAMLAVNPNDIENLLAGPAPATDAQLIDLSDRLTHIEAAVSAAFRPERSSS